MQAPCKDCPDRKLGCHSTCEKYLAYTEYRKKISEKRIEQNRIIADAVYTNRNRKIKKRW